MDLLVVCSGLDVIFSYGVDSGLCVFLNEGLEGIT